MNATTTPQTDGEDLIEQYREKLTLLTDAEMAVFKLYGRGFDHKEIATQLCRAPSTILVHTYHIKKKLRTQHVVRLTAFAAHMAHLSAQA